MFLVSNVLGFGVYKETRRFNRIRSIDLHLLQSVVGQPPQRMKLIFVKFLVVAFVLEGRNWTKKIKLTNFEKL